MGIISRSAGLTIERTGGNGGVYQSSPMPGSVAAQPGYQPIPYSYPLARQIQGAPVQPTRVIQQGEPRKTVLQQAASDVQRANNQQAATPATESPGAVAPSKQPVVQAAPPSQSYQAQVQQARQPQPQAGLSITRTDGAPVKTPSSSGSQLAQLYQPSSSSGLYGGINMSSQPAAPPAARPKPVQDDDGGSPIRNFFGDLVHGDVDFPDAPSWGDVKDFGNYVGGRIEDAPGAIWGGLTETVDDVGQTVGNIWQGTQSAVSQGVDIVRSGASLYSQILTQSPLETLQMVRDGISIENGEKILQLLGEPQQYGAEQIGAFAAEFFTGVDQKSILTPSDYLGPAAGFLDYPTKNIYSLIFTALREMDPSIDDKVQDAAQNGYSSPSYIESNLSAGITDYPPQFTGGRAVWESMQSTIDDKPGYVKYPIRMVTDTVSDPTVALPYLGMTAAGAGGFFKALGAADDASRAAKIIGGAGQVGSKAVEWGARAPDLPFDVLGKGIGKGVKSTGGLFGLFNPTERTLDNRAIRDLDEFVSRSDDATDTMAAGTHGTGPPLGPPRGPAGPRPRRGGPPRSPRPGRRPPSGPAAPPSRPVAGPGSHGSGVPRAGAATTSPGAGTATMSPGAAPGGSVVGGYTPVSASGAVAPTGSGSGATATAVITPAPIPSASSASATASTLPGSVTPKARVKPRTTFKTSMGSSYEVTERGTTIRTKSLHPKHSPDDVGLKPESSKTYYVKDQTAVVYWKQAMGNLKAGQMDYARDWLRRFYSEVSTEPAVGLMPFELWDDGTRHLGNEIVSISTPSNDATAANITALLNQEFDADGVSLNGHSAVVMFDDEGKAIATAAEAQGQADAASLYASQGITPADLANDAGPMRSDAAAAEREFTHRAAVEQTRVSFGDEAADSTESRLNASESLPEPTAASDPRLADASGTVPLADGDMDIGSGIVKEEPKPKKTRRSGRVKKGSPGTPQTVESVLSDVENPTLSQTAAANVALNQGDPTIGTGLSRSHELGVETTHIDADPAQMLVDYESWSSSIPEPERSRMFDHWKSVGVDDQSAEWITRMTERSQVTDPNQLRWWWKTWTLEHTPISPVWGGQRPIDRIATRIASNGSKEEIEFFGEILSVYHRGYFESANGAPGYYSLLQPYHKRVDDKPVDGSLDWLAPNSPLRKMGMKGKFVSITHGAKQLHGNSSVWNSSNIDQEMAAALRLEFLGAEGPLSTRRLETLANSKIKQVFEDLEMVRIQLKGALVVAAQYPEHTRDMVLHAVYSVPASNALAEGDLRLAARRAIMAVDDAEFVKAQTQIRELINKAALTGEYLKVGPDEFLNPVGIPRGLYGGNQFLESYMAALTDAHGTMKALDSLPRVINSVDDEGSARMVDIIDSGLGRETDPPEVFTSVQDRLDQEAEQIARIRAAGESIEVPPAHGSTTIRDKLKAKRQAEAASAKTPEQLDAEEALVSAIEGGGLPLSGFKDDEFTMTFPDGKRWTYRPYGPMTVNNGLLTDWQSNILVNPFVDLDEADPAAQARFWNWIHTGEDANIDSAIASLNTIIANNPSDFHAIMARDALQSGAGYPAWVRKMAGQFVDRLPEKTPERYGLQRYVRWTPPERDMYADASLGDADFNPIGGSERAPFSGDATDFRFSDEAELLETPHKRSGDEVLSGDIDQWETDADLDRMISNHIGKKGVKGMAPADAARARLDVLRESFKEVNAETRAELERLAEDIRIDLEARRAGGEDLFTQKEIDERLDEMARVIDETRIPTDRGPDLQGLGDKRERRSKTILHKNDEPAPWEEPGPTVMRSSRFPSMEQMERAWNIDDSIVFEDILGRRYYVVDGELVVDGPGPKRPLTQEEARRALEHQDRLSFLEARNSDAQVEYGPRAIDRQADDFKVQQARDELNKGKQTTYRKGNPNGGKTVRRGGSVGSISDRSFSDPPTTPEGTFLGFDDPRRAAPGPKRKPVGRPPRQTLDESDPLVVELAEQLKIAEERRNPTAASTVDINLADYGLGSGKKSVFAGVDGKPLPYSLELKIKVKGESHRVVMPMTSNPSDPILLRDVIFEDRYDAAEWVRELGYPVRDAMGRLAAPSGLEGPGRVSYFRRAPTTTPGTPRTGTPWGPTTGGSRVHRGGGAGRRAPGGTRLIGPPAPGWRPMAGARAGRRSYAPRAGSPSTGSVAHGLAGSHKAAIRAFADEVTRAGRMRHFTPGDPLPPVLISHEMQQLNALGLPDEYALYGDRRVMFAPPSGGMPREVHVWQMVDEARQFITRKKAADPDWKGDSDLWRQVALIADNATRESRGEAPRNRFGQQVGERQHDIDMAIGLGLDIPDKVPDPKSRGERLAGTKAVRAMDKYLGALRVLRLANPITGVPGFMGDVLGTFWQIFVGGQPRIGVTGFNASLTNSIRDAWVATGRDNRLYAELYSSPFLLDTGMDLPKAILHGFDLTAKEMGGELTWSRMTKKGGRVVDAVGNVVVSQGLMDKRAALEIVNRTTVYEGIAAGHLRGEGLTRLKIRMQEKYPGSWEDKLDGILSEARMGRSERSDTMRLEFRTGRGNEWGGGFSAGDVRRATGDDELTQLWAREVNKARDLGMEKVNEMMFSYEALNIDEILRRSTIFHYWLSRATPYHLRRATRNPFLLSGYYKIWQEIEDQREQERMPAFLSGMFKVLQKDNGVYAAISPLGILIPMTLFDAYDQEGGFMRSAMSLMNPIFAGALGFVGMTDFIPDLAGTRPIERFVMNFVNGLKGEGVPLDDIPLLGRYIDMDSMQFTMPIEQFITEVIDRSNNIARKHGVPIGDYKPFDRAANEKTQMRTIGFGIAEEWYGPMDSWDDETMQQVLYGIENVMNGTTGDSDFEEELLSRYGQEGLYQSLLSLASPGGVVTRSEKRDNYLYEAMQLGQVTPLSGLFGGPGDRTAAANAAEILQMSKVTDPTWVVTNNQFHQLGTPEGRKVYQTYFALMFGNVNTSFAVGGVTYTPDQMAAMSDNQRKSIADEWLKDNPGFETLVDEQRQLREQFLNSHPEYSDYNTYKSGVLQTGAAEFTDYMLAVNPNFARQYADKKSELERYGASGKVLEAELDQWSYSMAGYFAAIGQPWELGDKTTAVYDPTKDPRSNPLFSSFFDDSGGSSQSSGGSSDATMPDADGVLRYGQPSYVDQDFQDENARFYTESGIMEQLYGPYWNYQAGNWESGYQEYSARKDNIPGYDYGDPYISPTRGKSMQMYSAFQQAFPGATYDDYLWWNANAEGIGRQAGYGGQGYTWPELLSGRYTPEQLLQFGQIGQ